jgi:hypothetical protein
MMLGHLMKRALTHTGAVKPESPAHSHIDTAGPQRRSVMLFGPSKGKEPTSGEKG